MPGPFKGPRMIATSPHPRQPDAAVHATRSRTLFAAGRPALTGRARAIPAEAARVVLTPRPPFRDVAHAGTPRAGARIRRTSACLPESLWASPTPFRSSS